jgi:hypothetical protein
MRKYFLSFLLLFSFLCYSQSHEFGVLIGGSNYTGDIGNALYINPNDLAIGGLYRLNRSDRHSFRFSYSRYNIKASDADSDVPSRNLRGKSFENAINEFSVGIEFSFWEFNLHESGPKFSPYIHSGLNYINYKNLYFVIDNLREDGRKSIVAIPLTVGVKTRLFEHVILSGEVSAKYTFTDNLDGSNPDNAAGFNSFGNIGSKDWYVFTGIMLTYTFGKTPCFCNF